MATLHIDKIIAEKVNQDDLIRLLETMIDEEMQRPEAEMNCDLIDQCVDALLEIRQDRDHLAVLVPLMQDKAFLHLIQRKAGNTARLNGAARGALIAAAILASTISVNAMVDAAFDYNILEHIGKAISASVLGPEIIGGEDDVDEPTTVAGTTEKSQSTTVPERTSANENGETATRQPEQTTTAAAVTQPTTTTPTTTEREQESTTKKEPTTKKVTGDNVHHKPTQPDRPEETTKAVRVIGFNAQLGESFKSRYIYGEQLSYDGLTLTADWSDGTTKPVALKNCTYTTQVNMNRTADVTLNILYKGFLVEIPITVRPNEETRESTICQTDRYDYLLCKAGGVHHRLPWNRCPAHLRYRRGQPYFCHCRQRVSKAHRVGEPDPAVCDPGGRQCLLRLHGADYSGSAVCGSGRGERLCRLYRTGRMDRRGELGNHRLPGTGTNGAAHLEPWRKSNGGAGRTVL